MRFLIQIGEQCLRRVGVSELEGELGRDGGGH